MVIDWIKAELRARKLKDRALGDHMGWSSGQTSKVLGGTRDLKADEFMEVLKFLGIPSPVSTDAESEAQLAARHLSALGKDEQHALLALLQALRPDRS